MSSPKSARNSAGNSRSKRRKMRSDRDIRLPVLSGATEEHLLLGNGQRLFEPPSLGKCDGTAEWRELVQAAAIAVAGSFLYQPPAQEPLDDAVERARAQPDRARRDLLDIFHDRVAMRGSIGQR